MLQRYKEVIQLCERTLVYPKKNFSMVVGDNNKYNKPVRRLWKWHLVSKLEVVLYFSEKQKLLRSLEAKYRSNNEE